MRRDYYYGSPGFGGLLTPGVKGLLIANLAVYVIQMLVRRELAFFFGLTPALFWDQRALWQPVTYMFLHGGLTHILFNMLALWLFGGALETVWGSKRFLTYYFMTGIGAGLSNCILTPHMTTPIIGASGAVYGLLAAYGVLFPESLLYIWGLFPIKAKYLVLIFGGVEFLSSLHPGASPIAHLVHLGGMVIGVVYLKWGSWWLLAKRKSREWNYRQDDARRRRHDVGARKLQVEIDDLLDKINEVGLDNLTPWERRRLKDSSDRLKEMNDNR